MEKKNTRIGQRLGTRDDGSANATYLELIERETTAETLLEVVTLGLRLNHRAQGTSDRTRERLGRLGGARVATRLLAAS